MSTVCQSVTECGEMELLLSECKKMNTVTVHVKENTQRAHIQLEIKVKLKDLNTVFARLQSTCFTCNSYVRYELWQQHFANL